MNVLAESMNDEKSAVALQDHDEQTINVENDNQSSGETVEAAGMQLSPEEAVLKVQAKIEQQVLKYFQNKEIVSERNEENKMIFEELGELFEELGDDEVVIPLPSGQNAVLTLSIREKEVLDVDMLADEMKVPKDELKTPFDFCAFTAKGKLTPAMVTKHTSVEREAKLRISKRKATTKRRKKSQA
ncbi:hypothetical protein JZ785_15830 [Alicyclobacillus curvatus]|nr:hypothetical protein JZ785_15830 [Alicyclobacillus curvatus]